VVNDVPGFCVVAGSCVVKVLVHCPKTLPIPEMKIARVSIKVLKNDDEPLRAWVLDFRLKKV
jgi:hypothetical protein